MGPEGKVVPDITGKLPGRGMWVTATAEVLDEAIKKMAFSRAAKASVRASEDLPAQVEAGLLTRLRQGLGLASRAGDLITGYDQVREALRMGEVALLVEATDGAVDGREKVFALAHGLGADEEEWPQVCGCFSAADLGLALGRANVIHAAVRAGSLAEKLNVDLGRLGGFRAVTPEGWRLPGGNVDKSEASASARM